MSILNSIGNTPLVEIEGIKVKLEYLNPSGSVKDRIVKYIVEDAERKGLLKKGYTLVEASTGNTGIATSLVGAVKGYKVHIFIPKGLSRERSQIMKALGAEVTLVKRDCVTCAINNVKELAKRSGFFHINQFENPLNVEENEKVLGKEILEQTDRVDAFVAGVGSGGTLIGVGKALRKKFPKVKLVALEPTECSLMAAAGIGKLNYKLDQKICKHHGIEGIADGLIPKIIQDNQNLVDEVIRISTQEAIDTCKVLAKKGYFVGPSSGANILAAKKLKKKYRNVATLFPDRGDRYLSEDIFATA